MLYDIELNCLPLKPFLRWSVRRSSIPIITIWFVIDDDVYFHFQLLNIVTEFAIDDVLTLTDKDSLLRTLKMIISLIE